MAYGFATMLSDVLVDALDMSDTEADSSDWRARGLRYGQLVVDWVVNFCDHWDFRFGAGEVTLTGDSTVALTSGRVLLPTDFLKFGARGTVGFKNVRGILMKWKEPDVLFQLRIADQMLGQYPDMYTVTNFDTTTDEPYLYVYPFPTQANVLQLSYEKKSPTLTDADPGGMEYFPTEFGQIIKLGLEERLRKKIGSVAFDYSDDFKRMVAQQADSRKQGEERVMQIGSYGLRRYAMHALMLAPFLLRH